MTEVRADVDNSAWDGPAAMSGCAAMDDPAAGYKAICAGKKTGDPALQSSWALPHHKHPGDPPNAAGVRNSLSRLPQTDGLTNKAEAQAHLEAHMKVISPAAKAAGMSPREIRERRGQKLAGNRRGMSGSAARLEPFPALWRSAGLVDRDGVQLHQLDGYATVFEIEYEMWDMFGPYGETVAGDAADETLAANPDVAFLVNHKGLTMARTRSREGRRPTLELDADPRGLHAEAYVNPDRNDVHDLVIAVTDRDCTEMSFAFMITDAEWSDDFEHFRITRFDIDRGDVSAVTYGANPYTDIAARSRTIVSELGRLPAGAQRAALARLSTVLGTDGGALRADADEEVKSLIAALDATLDQATQLVTGVDHAALPPDVAQALDLLTGAETTVDELMDSLSMLDPSEPGELAAVRPFAERQGERIALRQRYARLGQPTPQLPAPTREPPKRAHGRSVEYWETMLRL
jgi:HK97 family phage prohead protease